MRTPPDPRVVGIGTFAHIVGGQVCDVIEGILSNRTARSGDEYRATFFDAAGRAYRVQVIREEDRAGTIEGPDGGEGRQTP